MTIKLAVPSVAILVANGFDENHITAVARALTNADIPYKMIASEQGLVNGWQDNAWGHYFTVDQSISTAMGSDYDCLILIGGERGTLKLKENLHTRRIINHFLEAGKPISAIDTAVELLALSPKSAGINVAACDQITDVLNSAQIEIKEDNQIIDDVVLTSNGKNIDMWVNSSLELFASYMENLDVEEEQAA